MAKLEEVAKYIRTKNAGPFWVTAEIFCDGINADRDATDYRHYTTTLEGGSNITVKLAPGGGWNAIVE